MNDIKQTLKERILVLDGAMGTALQDLNLTAESYGGEDFDGCHEQLNLTAPDIILSIHSKYLEAGANIIETNTFGATPLVLDEYDLAEKAYDINFQAAKIAKQAIEEHKKNRPDKPLFVAGSMGPTTKAITVTGGVTYSELIENFYLQAKALVAGGVDFLLLETGQDTRNIKAALKAIHILSVETNNEILKAVSGTIEPMGTMLGGQTIEALANSMAHEDLLYIGLNCATGPEFMTDYVRTLSEQTQFNVACVPNAGLPDVEGNYLETPQMLTNSLIKFMQAGWINIVGGCCGTTYEHISKMASVVDHYSPRIASDFQYSKSLLSGLELLEVEDDSRPYLVGERTNVIGSRKFKRLICEEKFDEAAEIGKAQIKNGANILDVCLANPDRDEKKDVEQFLEKLIQKIKVPLMIDSTDENVIESALTYSQGKAIINSINLEDGEERFEKIVPLARQYGAALVVGTIDDDPVQGMAVSRERKLAVAERSYDLLTKKYGLKETDIYWDPLVFPCATGDENYVGSAIETIEGIRLIKKKYPKTKIVLGISNVSFGLPAAGREVLNSVFTYHCTQAGLDLALVNTQHFKRYNSIAKEEIDLANNLLQGKGDDPIGAFANFYREKKVETTPKKDMPLMQRIPQYIIEGTKDGLVNDIELALQELAPMEVINGPLMEGMEVVGKLFNENKLIVAEVLQSAEAMKTAVAYLEPLMEKHENYNKGKILLATVKGDVHDIGKNLVDIVLSNNGFDVVNLGIKVPSDKLISAIAEHKPDIVGLSGLLVKSAQQMVHSAEDLKNAGIEVPILVGGAALSKRFVDTRISSAYAGTVVYAQDAMQGLSLANTILEPEQFEKLKDSIELSKQQFNGEQTVNEVEAMESQIRSTEVKIQETCPMPQDFERHVIKNTPVDVIFKYVNPLMLYGRHLGISGKLVRLITSNDSKDRQMASTLPGGNKALEIYDIVHQVKDKYKSTHFPTEALFQFFKVKGQGNEILFSLAEQMNYALKLPRQKKTNGLCLSDYVSPTKEDSMALFVVTVGKEISQLSKELKDKGDFLHSHVVQALALELAEGYAEYLHSKIRAYWGFSDGVDMTMMDRFQAKYPGKRYSFGYPACPDLDSQQDLWQILKPSQDINCHLTEGCMMDPEASVSALVFHHPQAKYFSVSRRDS